eukprot:scaffold265012_cov31-Prasinocladus_malaysianus.AAC.1
MWRAPLAPAAAMGCRQKKGRRQTRQHHRTKATSQLRRRRWPRHEGRRNRCFPGWCFAATVMITGNQVEVLHRGNLTSLSRRLQ